MRRLALMLCALACAPTLRAASFAVDRLDDAVDMLPGDGVMHPKNRLDTLGADAPEKQCKARA